MPELLVICPGQPDLALVLEGGGVTIGRSEECDAWIAEKKSSRQHMVIRPVAGGGWVAEDLASSNGTWFGGQRILRHLLADGDVLSIGDTEIRFVGGAAPAAGEAAAAVVSGTLDLKPVDASTPAADLPERVAPASDDAGSSVSNTPVSAGRRDAARIGGRALMFVAAGILAIVGVEMFLGKEAEQASREQDAEEEARRTLVSVNLPHEEFAREVALYRDRFPDSPQLAALEAHVRFTEERDAHRELVRSEFEQLKSWPEGIEPSDMRFRLQSLVRRLPRDERFAVAVQQELAKLDRHQQTLDTQSIDRLEHQVTLALDAGSPARAMRLLAAFRHASPGLTSVTLDRLSGLDTRAERSAQTRFDDAWRSAEDARSPAQARAALAAAWPGLAGTEQGTRIERRLRDVGKAPTSAPGTHDPRGTAKQGRPGTAKTPVAGVDNDVLTQADRARTLLLSRSWTAGRKELEAAIGKVDRGRLKNEWTQLLADTDRILALTSALGERASGERKPRMTLEIAGKVKVLEAGPGRVKVETGDGEKTWLWSQVADEDVLDLLTPSKPQPDQRVALAMLAADLGDKERFVEILLPLFEKGKDLEEANRVVAFRLHRRMTVPEGGYQAYRGQIVDQRGLVLAKQVERVIALRSDAAKLFVQVSKQKVFKKLAKLKAMRDELDERRRYALGAIFNEKHYPYPANKGATPYQSVQKEIDRRVAEVKALWDDDYKVNISRTGSVGKALEKWDAVVAELKEYGEDIKELQKSMAPYTLYAIGEPITIRNYFRDGKEKRLQLYNKWVMEQYNLARTENASPAERQQVRVTNDYRTMMGYTAMVRPGPGDFESIHRGNVVEVLDGGEVMKMVPLRAVRIDNRLVDAARDHSIDMARRGFFSHFAPPNPATGTGRTSPHERMAAAGYSGYGSSENIANGANAPERAHWMWVHSSGHHRNILSGWTDLGSGQAGRLWTQNFGSGGGARTLIAPDTDIHYPERRGR